MVASCCSRMALQKILFIYILCCIIEYYSTSISLLDTSAKLSVNITKRSDKSEFQEVALAMTNFSGKHKELIHGSYGPSLIAADIEHIFHFPSQTKIIVQLKKSSATRQQKCLNPRLFGRLSGPSVTLIQWETTKTNATNHTTKLNNNNNTIVNQIIGYYNVPSTGRYFIEVIGILCNDFSFDTNYQNICLEDPTGHRITNDNAFLDVAISRYEAALGHWTWLHNRSDNKPVEQVYTPLFTRFQPLNCRSLNDINTTRCLDPISLDRFSPYTFVYNNLSSVNHEETILAKVNLLEKREEGITLLCFVGLSHAREMSQELNIWLKKWNISNVVAQSLDAQFPRLVNAAAILRSKCTKTVIASGQWSAGRKPPGGRYRNLPPTLFPDYYDEVKTMILHLKGSGVTDFYLRSIHYNSLGDVKVTCPPQDWRSPPVIDRYNDIIQNLTSDMNVSYIDTNFIIGPMWDSARDFCHYRRDETATAEALYMLGRLLLE